jgi:peptide/nickel transport system permease protein
MSRLAARQPPGTPGFPLGADALGRDILSRVIHGARISLFVAITVVVISHLIGVILGTIVGYTGGLVDSLVSRIWDVMFSFPGIILFLVIMGTLGPGIQMVVIAMTIGSVPVCGRLMRERVIANREREYVLAAKALGANDWRIMFSHVVPNSLTPILVHAALAIPGIILAEAGLSYLGLGVPPPYPSWGKMIADGQDSLELAPWISLIPGIAILLATLGFNLAGDGLRDYLDPTHAR